jgi:hypothetical protein
MHTALAGETLNKSKDLHYYYFEGKTTNDEDDDP